jgi:glycosyltransferase involved in cell wall biosynthesis
MTEIKVSVVLGTYNQKETLKIVLNAYNNQTVSKGLFEVIVIDSSSPDGSHDMMQGLKPSFNLNPIKRENKGKTAARNFGVSQAKGSIILITDADMIPDPTLIETHINAHSEVTIDTCFEGVTNNMNILEWPTSEKNLYPYIRESLKPLQKLGWWYFLTGNISFPKTLFDSESGFSEKFKGYGWEDLELGYRLFKKKVPLRFLPAAKNYHYHVVTQQEEIERNVKKGESAQDFLKMHPELKWFLGLNPLSKFIFPKISETGWFFNRMQVWFSKSEKGIKHDIGFWFLKEYFYLKGLVGF